MTRLLRAALVAALAGSALFAVPAVAKNVEPTFLVFTGSYGFRHDGISEAVGVLQQRAEASDGFDILSFAKINEALGLDGGDEQVTSYDDPRVLDPEVYDEVKGVILIHTTGLGGAKSPLDAVDRATFLDFFACGAGLVGIHAAADSGGGWPEYDELLGSRGFDSHPHFSFESRDMPTGNRQQLNPSQVSDVVIQVEGATHPTGAAWNARHGRFTITDEIYRYEKNPRELANLQVILSLDEQSHYWKTEFGLGPSAGELAPAIDNPVPNPVNAVPVTAMPDDYPVAWVRDYDENLTTQGRVFYTNLGHNMATWENPLYQNHVVAGIKWVAEHSVDRTCTET